MRTSQDSVSHTVSQQILPPMYTTTMSCPTNTKQPLGERGLNIMSPCKSPSKVPLPPSPTMSPRHTTKESRSPVSFAEEIGPMDEMFRASTLSQKPALVRKISEAHNNGQAYVSPSDDILSPTTKKLTEVKARRFGYVKLQRTLHQTRRRH